MKLSRASIALYIGLVFLSGAALGVFGDQYYAAKTAENANAKGKGRRPSPEEFRKGFLGYMKKDLGATDDQLNKLNAVMDETRSLMDDLHKRQQPEEFEIQRSQQDKIRALLTPEQRDKYDATMKRMQEFNKGNKNNKGRNGGF
jgi:Spy/CpxP family protein refolding chaperone